MKQNNTISLKASAITAGIGLLIMAIAAPIAEFYLLPKLVIAGRIEETTQNILANQGLFNAAIMCYLLTFLCDIVVAWALYILLKPANSDMSALAAGFRLIYSILAIVAIYKLIQVSQLVADTDFLKAFQPNQLHTDVKLSLSAFKNEWHFSLFFFSIHLILLGYLVIKSDYIPMVLGILLIISGIGYLLNSIRPFLFSQVNVDFTKFTFFGELIFMLWLLIKGWNLKSKEQLTEMK